MENLKTLGEIKNIIEREKNGSSPFFYLNIQFEKIDTEKSHLIYKFREYISMTTLIKLKNIIENYMYSYLVSNDGKIIIFPLK